MVLVHHVDLDFAEAARELDLPRRRELLRREQQHLVREERVVDRAKRGVVDAALEVDASTSAPSLGVSEDRSNGHAPAGVSRSIEAACAFMATSLGADIAIAVGCLEAADGFGQGGSIRPAASG